jgi:type II secretory pathway pseudopilin PulG
MHSMEVKPFTKNEIFGLGAVFLILIGVSTPNFIASIKRARDQVRRDDMAAIEVAMSMYLKDFGSLPSSSPDGRIMACKKPGDKVEVDSKGRLLVNLIPCKWGRDSIIDLTPGSTKVYLDKIPQDPDTKKGVTYVYFSDGKRYQIFTSFEVRKQAEYDLRVVARNIACGTRICNVGRSYNCPIDKSIEEYAKEIGQ